MASLSKKTIQHFTHCHSLTELSANKEFLCDGCNTLGNGIRYRCERCDFDLHDHCGTCPMELSSFMHQHGLKLVLCKQQLGRVCDLCDDPVEGLFYRCNLCDFDVHPPCTKLPQYIRHVMHKDHPLRLQAGSVPGTCMVCKDTCTSWHYRCGICGFDLHLECVLAPCKQVTKTSLKTPAPPQSASPFLDPYYAYGYGNPSSSGVIDVNSRHTDSRHDPVKRKGGKARKKMYKIAEALALGVLGNMLYGALTS
ncbi:hypothetical protein PTKIN_Ptkin13bG0286800 [Pterospermum kingtungense]